MSGLSPEVQALKDEGNKNFRVAEYLKAAASYTKALKQAERDGSEQCVATKLHHETSHHRVFSRAPTRSFLRCVPRVSRQRRGEKPLLSRLTPIAPIVAFFPTHFTPTSQAGARPHLQQQERFVPEALEG